MFEHWWKIIRAAVLVTGGLLSFFVFIEILHAYQVLSGVHPIFGYGFLFALILGAAWAIGYVVIAIRSRPPVLIPPQISDINNTPIYLLRPYGKYLFNYMKRLEENPLLDSEIKIKCKDGRDELNRILAPSSSKEELIEGFQDVEEKAINPAISTLDRLADKEIRRSVRDITFAVSLSPYRAADLLIVLYRNIGMILRVIHIYNSRPRFREQALIFRDTVRVVATVNFFSFGKKLLEGLFSNVPFIGRYVDDMAQGVGAGLLTSASGHVVSHRCRAFQSWDRNEASKSLASSLSLYLTDVRKIITTDVLEYLKPRIFSVAPPEEAGKPGFWDGIVNGVSSSIDSTGKVLDTFVRVPAQTATKAAFGGGKNILFGAADISKTVGKSMGSGGIYIKDKVASGSVMAWRGMKKLLKLDKEESDFKE